MKTVSQQAGAFFVVSLAGLVVDVGIAWLLNAALDWPLSLAAVCGFVVATCLNYLANIRWTFRSTGTRGSMRGVGLYFLAVSVSLLVRIAAIEVLQRLLPDHLQIAPLILVIAAGVSFFVSFFLSRRFVFR